MNMICQPSSDGRMLNGNGSEIGRRGASTGLMVFMYAQIACTSSRESLVYEV